MNTLLDLKPQFFDEFGHILADGRLLVYVLGTTTHAELYSDPAMSLPVANPVGLSSAGWSSVQLYSPSDLTVLVQSLDGYDEMDQPIYSTVKDFDVVASGASGASYYGLSVVDTIVDLRGLSDMVDGQMIAVKGYAAADDSFQRVYIWDADSVAVDDGGAVVSASAAPVGRWLLRYDEGSLDIRAFGVLAGAGDVNSQFRAACNWAYTNGVRLFIPKGVYNMAAGGTFDAYCALDVAEGVVFNRGSVESSHPAEWYHLSIYNPRTTIVSTFAGTNVHLLVKGDGWESTNIPVTAFASHLRSWCHGTGMYNLVLTDGSFTFDSDCFLHDVILPSGSSPSVSLSAGVTVYANALRGDGVMYAATENAISFDTLDTKLLPLTGNSASYLMAKCQHQIRLSTDVTLHNGFSTGARICGVGGSIGWANGSSITLGGGVVGGSGTIIGYTGADFGANPIDARLFVNPRCVVESWNISSSIGELDLCGRTTSAAITRTGTIRNGGIGGVTCSAIVLRDVDVSGQVLCTNVKAKDSSITYAGNALPNLTSSKLSNVQIDSTSPINAYNGVWSEVTVTNDIVSVGGSARLRDVVCRYAEFIPDSALEFGNFSWVGGSATRIRFDATKMPVDGTALAYNVVIQHILNLSGDITSINGSAKKWAFSGHYNVRIGNNESGKATFGTIETTVTGVYNGNGAISAGLQGRVFVFAADDAENVSTFSGFAQVKTAKQSSKAYDLYSPSLSYSNAQKLFYLSVGDYKSAPVVGDLLYVTFEVYK